MAETGGIYQYDPDTGSYFVQKNLAPEIFRLLGDERKKISDVDTKAIIGLVKNYPELQISSDQFNKDTTAINTKAGVLEWSTGILFDHAPEESFTYCIDASILPCVEADLCTPTFDQFCETSLEGDPKKKKLLLEILGYCLSDTWGTRTAFLLHGAPSSGKSVMLGQHLTITHSQLSSQIAPQKPLNPRQSTKD